VQTADFQSDRAGTLTRTTKGNPAFVPCSLPPSLDLGPLLRQLSQADHALGRLAGLSRGLPKPQLLMAPFLRREAVLSSRIEGTLTSLSDLLLFEAAPELEPAEPDVREVSNYLRALDYALAPQRELPLSLRLIREIHRLLMTGVRGNSVAPGEFRTIQNFIGPATADEAGATMVPPPVPEMHAALDAFEKYLHQPSDLPPLVRLALVHYQFEAIHPFLDGNGRVGRLLITVMLCEEGLLDQPLLYLSAFFERRKAEYYRRLLAVSQRGEFEAWIGYVLEGVATEAGDVIRRADLLYALREEYRDRLKSQRASSLWALVDLLFEKPAVMATTVMKRLDITHRSAMQALTKLEALGVVSEPLTRKRNRIFLAHDIQRVLAADVA
jgi:Fic family protein